MKQMALSLIALAGCAGATPPPQTDLSAGECKAEAAARLVGQLATPALTARARKLTGSSLVRRVLPGQAMTMDYRGGRLNIFVDAKGRVERFTCG